MAIDTRVLNREPEPGVKPLADAALNEELTPERVARLYLDDVWRYVSAHFVQKEEAEDVTMEVFASAFGNLRALRRAASPKLWLLGIARRKVADSLRRRYRRNETALPDSLAGSDSSGTLEREALRQALAGLPEDQAEALRLKYVAGLTSEEAGQVMGRSAEAVNSLLQRGRDALRGRWTNE